MGDECWNRDLSGGSGQGEGCGCGLPSFPLLLLDEIVSAYGSVRVNAALPSLGFLHMKFYNRENQSASELDLIAFRIYEREEGFQSMI